MIRLDHASEVIGLARELGVGGGAPVDGILGLCRRRIDGWVAEAGGVCRASRGETRGRTVDPNSDRWLIPLAEAARRLGLVPGTVRYWAGTGDLPTTPQRGRRLVRLADLKAVAAVKLANPRAAAVRRARAERTARYEDDEPTAEELEALIAEQLANLPDWWSKEARRQHRARGLTIRVIPKSALLKRGSA